MPFQRSASGTLLPEVLTYSPTAVHAFAAVHDTPFSPPCRGPGGLGVGSIDHPDEASAVVALLRAAAATVTETNKPALNLNPRRFPLVT